MVSAVRSPRGRNPSSRHRHALRQLERELADAPSYPVWRAVAEAIDQLTGAEDWKQDNVSSLYDFPLIAERLATLRKHRLDGDDRALMRSLREGLYHDLGNMGHPLLYSYSRVGTKHLIEQYVAQVCEALDHLCDQPLPFMTAAQKIRFFAQTLHSYGQPALMFSGGATLGLFHAGVCKALHEQDLLPRVLTGSSAGSLMAGMLGTHTDAELESMYHGEGFFSEAFKYRPWRDILRGGGIADVQTLKHFLRQNLGEYTFEEAFERTGRHINMVVAPYEGEQSPRVMNELTSPYLLMWSASLASCAVPVLFPPVRLTTKNAQGDYQLYMPSTRWVDGSVRSDFPRDRIDRLYNINFTIACQVNPHVVPFMQPDHRRLLPRPLQHLPVELLRTQGKVAALQLLEAARHRLDGLPALQRLADHGHGIMGQRYYGDINIVGEYGLRHYSYMLRNPVPQLFQLLMREGERATWPRISMIETHGRIGRTLDRCLQRLQRAHGASGSQPGPSSGHRLDAGD